MNTCFGVFMLKQQVQRGGNLIACHSQKRKSDSCVSSWPGFTIIDLIRPLNRDRGKDLVGKEQHLRTSSVVFPRFSLM